MINKAIIIGNLGRDPEARATANSTGCSFSIATNERRKDRDGNWGDHTELHNVVCGGKTAENVAKYCQKGKQVYVEGRLQTRKWQDKEGNDKYTTEIVADQVRFMRDNGQAQSSPRRAASTAPVDDFMDHIV